MSIFKRVATLMLFEFIALNREELIARTRAKIATRLVPLPTERELTSGAPLFLDELAQTLQHPQSPSTLTEMSERTATARGAALLGRGYTVAQVVHDYGDICQAITELADETQTPITTDEFQTLNRCLDDAIAEAVTEYVRLRDRSTAKGVTERSGVLAHELRNAVGAALLSFQSLQAGRVGVGGSTAALLGRSLRRLSALVDSAVAEVRLESELTNSERVSIREFVEESEVWAALEARARGLTLAVAPVERGLDVEVDRQFLAAAVANLLQNAFKFTRPQGLVSLDTFFSTDRVLIEVQDQCGGLPPGKAEELFRPFEQRSVDRTGMGLGLSITRRSVQAIGGELRVRDVPGIGCVFTIDLPRLVRTS